jgi:uncharacterized membrane protein
MTTFRKAILFLTLVTVSLLAGRAFWAGVVDDPANFPAATYVAYFQGVDRAIERPIATMGIAALLLTGIATALSFRDRPVFYILLAAFGCVVVSTFVTVHFHLPINHQIASFNPASLPTNWPGLRDRWWGFHKVRLVALLAAMNLIFLAVPMRQAIGKHKTLTAQISHGVLP